MTEAILHSLKPKQRIAVRHRAEPTLWSEQVALQPPGSASCNVIIPLSLDMELLQEDLLDRSVLEVKRMHGRRAAGVSVENLYGFEDVLGGADIGDDELEVWIAESAARSERASPRG